MPHATSFLKCRIAELRRVQLLHTSATRPRTVLAPTHSRHTTCDAEHALERPKPSYHDHRRVWMRYCDRRDGEPAAQFYPCGRSGGSRSRDDAGWSCTGTYDEKVTSSP